MILIDPWVRQLSGEVVAVSVGGAPMQLDLTEFVQRKRYLYSISRRGLRFLRCHLKTADKLVDVGTNVRVLAVETARAVGA